MITIEVRQQAAIGKYAYAVTIESTGDGDWVRITRSGEGLSLPAKDIESIVELVGRAAYEFAAAKEKLR